MENQQNVNSSSAANAEQPNVPSIHELACPKCQNRDLNILGTKGSKGAAIGMGMALGAVGNLIANASNKDDFTLRPIQYKCKSCGNKFESLPLVAKPEEILEKPCTVNFHRLSRFVGMAVSQDVYLNGVKVGTVGNGKSITFETVTKHNTIFVADQYGVAFKGDFKFEAQAGGTVEVRFKGKFV